MAESQWFYMRDGKRVGPVGLSAMREMVARGELPPEASVWTVGMNQWSAAADVRTLSGNVTAHAHAPHAAMALEPHEPHAPHAPAPAPAYASAHARVGAVAPSPASTPAARAHDLSGATAAAPVEVSPVGYYGAGAGVPPRAMANLKGHARPTGDTGDWPLDDARVAHFAEAVTVRKKVTGAAQLYRALLFLSALTAGVLAVVFAFVLIDPPRGSGGGARGMDAITMGITLTFLVGLCALYYFTWRATTRAHRWAPLTMLIIFVLGMLANLFSIAGGLSGRGDPAALVGGLVGVALSFLFAFVSLQSLLAIPRYLAQPAWCQELIVKAGL